MTKIARIEPIPIEYPDPNDFGTIRRTVLVRVETDDGLVGWGEGKNAAGSAGEYAALVHLLNHEVAPQLIGRNPGDITAKIQEKISEILNAG